MVHVACYDAPPHFTSLILSKGCIIPWQRPVRETIEPLKKAQEIGSQTGDVEFSCLNAALWASVQFYTDEKLSAVSSRIGDVINVMSARRQDTWLAMLKPFHQLTINLMGLADDPGTLVLESCKQADPGSSTALVCFRLQQMMLSYLLGDYDTAGKIVAEMETHPYPPPGMDGFFLKFFVGMTHLQSARRLKGMHRWMCLNKAKKAIEVFRTWSRHSPHNCLPMKFLLEAELASYQGKNKKAYEKYTAATALAVDSGFRMVEAMTHEHAGRHLFSTGDEALAAASFEKALTCFKDWGAIAKFKNLEDEVHAAFEGSSVGFQRLIKNK
jgi:histidine kinase